MIRRYSIDTPFNRVLKKLEDEEAKRKLIEERNLLNSFEWWKRIEEFIDKGIQEEIPCIRR